MNLLGIDSVMKPYPARLEAWKRIVTDLPLDRLEALASESRLEDLPALGQAILKGEVRGRVIVRL